MAFKDLSDLNDMQIDVLKEIGNIGSGNAATSLSSMLMHPVGIEVPHIAILDYNSVVDALGGPESMIVSLMLFLSGDVEGMIMFLLQKDFAHMTLSSLLGEEVGDFNGEDEMANSALTEVGNIMAASFVNAISTMTGLNIGISVPDICIDMCGAILSVPAIHYADISDKIIFIQDQFNSMENQATSHVLLIPDVESLAKIMTNLGIEI